MRILGLVFAAFLSFIGVAANANQLTFSIPQARALARDAYLAGDHSLANQLAQVLLEHDPKDSSALILIAATSPTLGRPAEGRKAGRLAFRNTDNTVLKFEAAQFTAKAALLEKRYGASQFWLRKAAHVAPNEDQRAQAIRDFRFVRSINPWRTELSFSLAPLSNINGGSDTDLLIIDDIWAVGVLSGDAQALSGYRTTINANTTYRLSHSETTATHVGLRFYQTLNALSTEAKALAPLSTGSDFNLSLIESSLRHTFSKNPAKGWNSAELTLGHMWYGGVALASYGRLKFGRTMQFNARTSASLQVSAERQWQAEGQGNNLDIFAIRASAAHKFANNNSIGITANVRNLQSLSINSKHQGASLQLNYTLAKPIATASVSFGLGASVRDYDAYRIGFILITDGRKDERLNASVNLFFKDIDYMGFAPTVSLNASQTTSNISRFETSGYSIAVGFRSTF